jgi:GNAT superfamily N-acetyltransferase
MITIRTMTAADVPWAMALKEQALWNQTPADWRRFLELEPDGCFAALWQGQAAGTAAAFAFGTVGWIAMVLVERSLRGRGIATRLMEHALAYLDQRGVRTVRLDATPLGRPIYERLGFAPQWELARLGGVAGAPGIGGEATSKMGRACPVDLPSYLAAAALREGLALDLVPFSALTLAQWADVAALDRQASGTDRQRLLAHLNCDAPGAARAFIGGGRLRGYAMLRSGSRATQIGPAVALDDEAGHALLHAVARQTTGRAIFIDVPEDNLPAIRWAQSQALAVERRFTRMIRGQPIVEQPEHVWASSGPEKG